MTMRQGRAGLVSVMVAAAALVLGCRGNKFKEPPIHLQQNMFAQAKFKAQEENDFYADKRAMRPPVRNTIARGQLVTDPLYNMGYLPDSDKDRAAGAQAVPLRRGADGRNYALYSPVPVTREVLARGAARYRIYCQVCHGGAGDGQSIMLLRGMRLRPPSYMEWRLLAEPLGYFFQVISRGVRNMPAYGAQIPAEDRWAIAAYVRALQLAGHAPRRFVPDEIARSRGWQIGATSDARK